MNKTAREDLDYEVIGITETIGVQLADLGDMIESYHYDPEQVDQEGLETLYKIKNIMAEAIQMANKARKA